MLTEETLRARLDPKLFNLLLFLDVWDEPEGFTKMSQKDRLELLKKLRESKQPDGITPVWTIPTETNYWVWFGCYDPPRYLPKYAGKQVARLLRIASLGDDVGGKRIVRNWSDRPFSDFNPYKSGLAIADCNVRHSMRNIRKHEKSKGQLFKEFLDNCPLDRNDPYQMDLLRKQAIDLGFDVPTIEKGLNN